MCSVSLTFALVRVSLTPHTLKSYHNVSVCHERGLRGGGEEAYNLKLRAKDGRANEFRHDCEVMAGVSLQRRGEGS